MKNCIVAQSGGPTVAINASLAGVIAGVLASEQYDRIYGACNGITGILENRIVDLGSLFAHQEGQRQRLIMTPSVYLGSCRYKLPTQEEAPDVYRNIFALFQEKEINAFFYIGGNDSMDTAAKLSAYAKQNNCPVRIIGIPKTIDNDLVLTDHTPGFGSAAKFIAASFLEMSYDVASYRQKSVLIVEVMGRDAGWLTAASTLARRNDQTAPHLVYLPERPFDPEQFLHDVTALLERQDQVVVAVSEGIRDGNGAYISASQAASDVFGHNQLSGTGRTLEALVKERLHVKTRSVELNVPQRCAAHLASATDLAEAEKLGKKAVAMAELGRTGEMVSIRRISSDPYEVVYESAPLQAVANEVRRVPDEWINKEGNDVTDKMQEYLRPLILGEPELVYQNGLPSYLPLLR